MYMPVLHTNKWCCSIIIPSSLLEESTSSRGICIYTVFHAKRVECAIFHLLVYNFAINATIRCKQQAVGKSRGNCDAVWEYSHQLRLSMRNVKDLENHQPAQAAVAPPHPGCLQGVLVEVVMVSRCNLPAQAALIPHHLSNAQVF